MRPSTRERMRVLVTGATGPYGAHFAAHCLGLGHEVFSVRRTRRPHDAASLLGITDRISWVDGDVRDRQLVEHCLADWRIQAVAHFAALPIVSTAPAMLRALWSVNVDGALSMLEALHRAAPGALFLYASTDKALGHAGSIPYTEDMHALAVAPYDASKAAAEVACRSYQAMGYVPNLVVTRSCNIVASADMNWRLIPNTIRQFLCDVPAKVYTSGQWVREFVAVEDAVAAQYLCMMRADETPGEVFHIGSGHQWTQEQAIEHIREVHFPRGQVARVQPPAHHKIEIPYQTLDSSKVRRVHGWAPRSTVPEAVARLVEWWRSHIGLAAWSQL